MIPSKSTILELSMPRNGGKFTHDFASHGAGRIVEVTSEQWLAGENPVSYTPDHTLIWEHFHPSRRDIINQVIAEGGDNVKIVIPVVSQMNAMISANVMSHKGYFSGLDEFLAVVDTLPPHFKFRLDAPGRINQPLRDMLAFCNITSHSQFQEYANRPVINSAGDGSAEKKARLDDLKADYVAGRFTELGAKLGTDYDDLLVRKPLIDQKLAAFGFGVEAWT